MEERTSIIEVGDEILSDAEYRLRVDSVELGQYGLKYSGDFVDYPGQRGWGFVPYELPPVDEDIIDWYGWARRSYIILPNGRKVGSVTLLRNHDDSEHTTEEHNAEWQCTIETIKAMKAEEGVMQSRPTDIRLN